MKKFLLLFGFLLFFLHSRPVLADNGICNKSCQVNEECGKGYRCYVGICRSYSCPSSSNCECATATSTPSPTPNGEENLRVTPTPQPKATPIASVSGQLKKAPKTGASTSTFLYAVIFLALLGMTLKSFAKNT